MDENIAGQPPKSKRGLFVALLAFVVFLALYALVLRAYHQETEDRAAAITDDTEELGDNRIDTYAKIVSADPVKGDVIVRIEFVPEGAFTSDDGATLNRDLQFYVSSATGKQIYEFPKGKRMNPVEATVDMYEGEPMDYPFDQHKAQLTYYFDFQEPATAHADKPAAASKAEDAATEEASDAAEDDATIPIALNLHGSVSGLKIDAVKSKESTDEVVSLDLSITRAHTAKFFSVFIMCAMWLLTAAVLLLVFNVATRRKNIEVSMFSFLGALLFAFPALRNSQPGTPPIGTLGDFLAFFWVEVVIALSLITIISLWLARRPAK